MAIDVLGVQQQPRRVGEPVDSIDHVVVRQDGLVDGCKGGLMGGRLLEDVHDPLEIIFGETLVCGPPRIIIFQELIVFFGHIIRSSRLLYAFLDGLTKTDIGRSLGIFAVVEVIIRNRSQGLLWWWHGDFIVCFLACSLQ